MARFDVSYAMKMHINTYSERSSLLFTQSVVGMVYISWIRTEYRKIQFFEGDVTSVGCIYICFTYIAAL